ncbi:hypothetical protein VTI74DRAFT_8709 [Chaetomium olivicolor]
MEKIRLEAESTALKLQLQPQQAPKALINLDYFCQILAGPIAFHNSPQSDLHALFHHPANDLSLALGELSNSSCTTPSQSQVQSLLSKPQFHHFLSSPFSSLLLVDANLEQAALESLLHFPGRTRSRGPGGMVRSLIAQLVVRLRDLARQEKGRAWNLDFLDEEEYLEALERWELKALCVALHQVLYEFPEGVKVYVVADSVGCFDVERLWRGVEEVMGKLDEIVLDGGLGRW